MEDLYFNRCNTTDTKLLENISYHFAKYGYNAKCLKFRNIKTRAYCKYTDMVLSQIEEQKKEISNLRSRLAEKE